MIDALTWTQLLKSSLALFMAAVLLIPALSTIMARRNASVYDKNLLHVLLAAALMLIFNALSWLISHRYETIWIARLIGFLDYSAAAIAAAFSVEYVFCYIQKGQKPPKSVSWMSFCVAGAGIVFWLCLMRTNLVYNYDSEEGGSTGPLYLIAQIPIAMLLLTNAFFTIKNRKVLGKRILSVFLIYALYPLLALIPLAFGMDLLAELFFGLCIFSVYCIVHVDQSARNAEREIQLLELRSRLLFNQIQPKLIFNALNSIYCLCDENTEQAQNAVSDFADYLRLNIDTMNRMELIPFSVECRHTEKYLSLEKLRYEDRLNVVWDLQSEGNFRIPMLTIQPLVQNAVEHGINKRREGGTITICSKESQRHHQITISDNGIGFTFNQKESEPEIQNPLGLRGIRSRLKALCSGQLLVKSKPGDGTLITILIPKEERRL